ncbi:MAG: ABC transporter permease, partial [Candidatus Omnitrophica bacterium]|nr:ABC transporter permease [Candidatus Omnitrophota bacterium]
MIEAIKEIIQYRELLGKLTVATIKLQYKQTLLGVVWAVFTPLTTMLIFTFLNDTKILKIDTGNIPYPVFAYCGVLPWTLFANSLINSTKSLVSYSGLISKIYFPREIIPLSAILSRLLDFAIASVILFGLMLYYHLPYHITIVALPAILLIQLIFTAGLGFFFSIGNLFYRDVGYLVSLMVSLWMFITSVVYPIKVASPRLQAVLTTMNPMTPIIDSYRDVILM